MAQRQGVKMWYVLNLPHTIHVVTTILSSGIHRVFEEEIVHTSADCSLNTNYINETNKTGYIRITVTFKHVSVTSAAVEKQ